MRAVSQSFSARFSFFLKKKSPAAKSDASYDINEFIKRGEALPVYKKGS